MKTIGEYFKKILGIGRLKTNKKNTHSVKCVRVFSDKDTDNTFARVTLHGDDIERYIQDEIINYSHEISKEIFKTYFKPGKYSFDSYWRKNVPTKISFSEICGGSIEPAPKMCSKWILEIIHNFLTKNENAIVLMEDILFNKTDEEVEQLKVAKSTYLDKLYYVLTHQSYKKNPSEFTEALELVEIEFNDTIILIHDEQRQLKPVILENQVLPDSIIKKIVNNTEAVIFMAYDRQGYIMWELC